MQNHACSKCWGEEFSLTIFPAVFASPQKYCEGVRYWGICGETSPRGQVCYLDSSLPHMPAWMYFQNYFLQVHTIWHEMEHLHKQQSFTEELLTASLGMHWEFSTMYMLSVAMLSVLCWALHATGSLGWVLVGYMAQVTSLQFLGQIEGLFSPHPTQLLS